ncbi:DUF2860 family protein [Alkalimarinus coralli]|uniref:DUF2860 family protein n=1 Tax=Alkalimarinus coralli TaxID=2935863 RepID=UPI00202B2E11|nr:DUF2860 family protein [Alkalimarinus coralli]
MQLSQSTRPTRHLRLFCGLVTTGLLLTHNTLSARPLATQPGWGADIAIAAGYSKSQSQFNVDSENRVTDDLNNSGQEIEQATVIPLARLDYTLDSLKTQFFLGNSRENVAKGEVQIELGVTHQFEDHSQLTVAYFPELPIIGDTWKDPYVTGQQREETEEVAQGGRIELSNIAGSLFDVQYAFADSDIEDELSGNSLSFLTDADRQLLHRDVFFQRLSVDRLVPITSNLMLKPGLLYTRAEAKGDANSSDEYAVRLQVVYQQARHLLTGTALYGRLEADVDNPIFDKREKNNRHSLFALYKYQKPFNWENWSLLAIGFWGETDSNISFYNSSGLGIGIGAAYQWR